MIDDLNDLDVVQRQSLIRKMAEGKSVLHLGCTNYPYTEEAIDAGMLLHEELATVSKDLYGFDGDQAGIDLLAGRGMGNLLKVDLENLQDVSLDKTFEVIIAGEMIEHLNNPGLFLNGIKRFMKRDTKLVVTTVNAYCALRFIIYWLRGRGGVAEPVHPDHVAYYSYRTLKLLLSRHELHVSKFLFYDIGKEHRPHNPWYWNAINDVAVRLSPQLSDGLIAICGLDDESDSL